VTHMIDMLLKLFQTAGLDVWMLLMALLLFIIFRLVKAYRTLHNAFNRVTKRTDELHKMLVIEQDAHKDTQRLAERHTRNLGYFGEKVRHLKMTVREKKREIQDQTEELLKLQEIKRGHEKEKADREKERLRLEEEALREQQILQAIYTYYDDFSRQIFSVLNSERCRGTYYHVQTVATVAGNAAEMIGLSGEFVRAAAYFHDLGKSFNPKYFKENWSYNEDKGWRQENEEYSFYHRGKMILSHLPLGRILVDEQCQNSPTDLKEILAAFAGPNEWKEEIYRKAITTMSSSIEEHQGNTSIHGLFLASIKNGEGTTLEDFKYDTGRKPHSKENGIILLADSCDAAFEAISVLKSQDVETTIKNVFFLKLSIGLLSETGLTARELGLIFQSFKEFFTQRYKIGDRIEERQEEERIFYLETKANPMAECLETLRSLTDDIVAKRKVAYYFAHQTENLYKLKQVNDLISIMLTDLGSAAKDDIYFTNLIKALVNFYRFKIKDLLDIMKENKLTLTDFPDKEKITHQDFMSHPEIKNLYEFDNRFEEIIVRLNQIKQDIFKALINKDVLNRTDKYIFEAGLTIYHWLGRQDQVFDPICDEAATGITSMVSPENLGLISLEPGRKQISGVRGKILEIIPHFILNKKMQASFAFNVYFKQNNEFLKDRNGLFRTRNNGYVAIHSLFYHLLDEDEQIFGQPLNFPLAELHLETMKIEDLAVLFQIQRPVSATQIELLFEFEENVTLTANSSQ